MLRCRLPPKNSLGEFVFEAVVHVFKFQDIVLQFSHLLSMPFSVVPARMFGFEGAFVLQVLNGTDFDKRNHRSRNILLYIYGALVEPNVTLHKLEIEMIRYTVNVV